jgi:hypothetical protein
MAHNKFSLKKNSFNPHSSSKQIANVDLVRLSYEPYCFSEGIMFFSHGKSANGTFSHDFSAKRTNNMLLKSWRAAA